MATLIPSYGSCAGRMTPGERRLDQRLESKLEGTGVSGGVYSGVGVSAEPALFSHGRGAVALRGDDEGDRGVGVDMRSAIAVCGKD